MAKVYVVEIGKSETYYDYDHHERETYDNWIEGVFDSEQSAVNFMITKSLEETNRLVNLNYFVRPITAKLAMDGKAVSYAITERDGYEGCNYWMSYKSYDLHETKFVEGLA